MNIRQLYILILILGLTTGCEIYDEGFDLSSAVDPCIASGGNCAEPSGANLLALSINNTNPAIVKSANGCASTAGICVFDISGRCNEADYSENIIEYRVFDIATLADVIGLTQLFNICKRGKFRFQVSVPAGDVQIAKRLSIEVVGKDLDGSEARNPLAARREVDLLLIP